MRNSLFGSAALAAIAMSACVASAAPAHTIAEDAKAFGTREMLRQVDISPSGKKVVMIASATGVRGQ